jgi:heme exporter protein A
LSEARLALVDVACVRGGRLLFDHLDLTLAAGQAAVIVGPNGRGKSSLLRMVAGLLAPAAGRITVEGRIALHDERHALDPELPLARALRFWAALDGSIDPAAGLVAMGIEALVEVPVRLLSTGQRQRASLARVIASNAAVWLLDEPGNGLDEASLARLTAAMASHRSQGGIVLAASHQPLGLDDARQVAL